MQKCVQSHFRQDLRGTYVQLELWIQWDTGVGPSAKMFKWGSEKF